MYVLYRLSVFRESPGTESLFSLLFEPISPPEHSIKRRKTEKGLRKLEDYQRYPGVRPAGPGPMGPDNFPVAMAYVPWQRWNRVYDLEKALSAGTIFPELDKPFLGVRGGCR